MPYNISNVHNSQSEVAITVNFVSFLHSLVKTLLSGNGNDNDYHDSM